MSLEQMVRNQQKSQQLKELVELAETPEEELSKMNYKEKQKVFRAKSKLCNVFHRGGTYTKRKEVK